MANKRTYEELEQDVASGVRIIGSSPHNRNSDTDPRITDDSIPLTW